MPLTPAEANYYHDRGMMPDWAWFQQNGRTAQENYKYQKDKMRMELEQRRQEEEQQKQIEKQIQEGLDKAIDKAMKDLFKGFKG